jgi:ActR/RegA family two-component response regulator
MKFEAPEIGASIRLNVHAPAVLIIDDDATVCEILSLAFRISGCHAVIAESGEQGLTFARSRAFDLVVIDLRLPDMLGIDVARALRADRFDLRFVLVSGFLSTQVTVEAMKLGAVDVIEKPIDSDHLLALTFAARTSGLTPLQPVPVRRVWSRPSIPLLPARPRSNAERWAVYAFKACECDGDLKTLEDWASFVGVSYSTLCETCRLVRMRPHDARDLVRLLRAVVKSRREGCRAAVLLDVSDRRTLRMLLTRAGLTEDARGETVSLETLFARQKFVQPDNEALQILRQSLTAAPTVD